MQDLRMYPNASIEAAANEVMEHYRLGAISTHELGADLSRFVLRDSEGIYCAYDARQGRWYRHISEVWGSVSSAADLLEGPADLPVDRQPVEDLPQSETLAGGQAKGEAEPILQTLPRIARMIAKAYADGQINLLAANEVLQANALIDRMGRPWMPGARTGKWYAYAAGAWKASRTPPAEEDFINLNQQSGACQFCGAALEGLPACPNCHKPVPPAFDVGDDTKTAEVIEGLLEAAGSLPEALSEPWDPPAWYPDAIQIDGIVCPTCQEENKASSNFCNRCGTVLAPLRIETAPPAALKFCTHCGAELKSGKKFCGNCGKPVAEKADHGIPR